MIVYGRNPVAELVRAGRRRVHQVWATKDPGVPFTRATPEELTARAGTDAHQGVVTEADPYHYVHAAELLGQEDIDGALVGGASLDPADFAAIVNAA